MIKRKNFDELYAEFYDIIYKDKDYSLEVSEFINLISSYDYDKKKILDFGCGTGRHISYLQNYFEKVFGYDISQSMLDIARKNLKSNKIFFTNDINELNNQKFDVITSFFDVLSYLNKKEIFNSIKFFENISNLNTIVYVQFWEKDTVLTYPPESYFNKTIDKKQNITRSCNIKMDKNSEFVKLSYLISNNQDNYEEEHKLYLYNEDEIENLFNIFNFKKINAFIKNEKSKIYSKKMLFIKQ